MSAKIKPVTDSPPSGLYQKLIEVMEEVGRVEKKGFNSFHNYAYVKEDDLVEAVRGKLSERRILLLPSLETCEREGTLTTINMTFTFVDAVSGETHICKWAGTGDDKGDKGLYKAYTGAEKYFLMKSFLIPTGDDPEGDEKTDKRAEAKAKKATQRDALIEGVYKVFGLLNKTGEDPQWTPRLMNEFAIKTYGARVQDLEKEPLEDLIKKLSLRLDDLRNRQDQVEGVEAPKCDCGIPRVRKSGTKNGKPWAGWMCANRAEECKPVWIDLNAEQDEETEPF